MKQKIIMIVFLLITSSIAVYGQQVQSMDDDLTLEGFSSIVKNEWAFLRDGIDQMNNEVGSRGEFETTSEFQVRAARTRQGFIDKLSKHIKDTKLDRRVFGVWYKAVLKSYDADNEIYTLKSSSTIDAPYDLPSVECIIPANPYVEMADSIKGGYRTSNIRLKFEPDLKWKVGRSEAINAKNNEQYLYFKIHFTINILQENFTNQAKLRIIPTDIALMHQQNKYVFWKDEIK